MRIHARARAHVTYRNKLPFHPQAPKRLPFNQLVANHFLPFWEEREDQNSISPASLLLVVAPLASTRSGLPSKSTKSFTLLTSLTSSQNIALDCFRLKPRSSIASEKPRC